MEIKVQCECGQRYKFDVEPVNGAMPYAVNCPLCNEDGTNKANVLIQQQLALGLSTPSGLQPLSVPIGSQPPSLPPPLSAASTAAPSARGLRIHVPPPQERTPPPVPPRVLQPTQVQGTRPGAKVATKPAKRSDANFFARGVIGAVVAGFVGMILWFLLIKLTGFEIGYAAWGVGLITGVGAKLMSRQGSTLLGLMSGLCALVAIIGGQYLAARSEVMKEFGKIAATTYATHLEYAQSAAKLETDREIRTFLAKENSIEQSEVTAEDIKTFRTEELPELRDMASGKMTIQEYVKKFSEFSDSWAFQLLILKESLGWFTLLWLFLGVGSAYKLGADAD